MAIFIIIYCAISLAKYTLFTKVFQLTLIAVTYRILHYER